MAPLRRSLAAVVATTALAALTLPTPAVAKSPSDSPDYVPTPGASSPHLPRRAVGSSSGLIKSGTAVAAPPVSLSMACPAGMRRGSPLYSESFEKGTLPESGYTKGWTLATSGAAAGSAYATSTIPAGATLNPDYPDGLYLPMVEKVAGTNTVLSFAIKGTYPEDAAYVRVNDESGWIDPSSSWGDVTLDITAATKGELDVDVAFYNMPASTANASTMDLDAVSIYSCAPVAATGVRGDVTGDGRADLLGVNAAGEMYVAAGNGRGAFGTPVLASSGWGRMVWMGSPGDLTGDKRPDLLAKRDDGYLYLYTGRGMGSFTSPVILGKGWGTMNAIALPGDMNGDGRQELVARNTAGVLYRYTFGTGGKSLTAVTRIGTGWKSFTNIVSPGDYTGDKRGDLLARRSDGRLFLYATRSNGTLYAAKQIGTGWQSFTALAVPGDTNGNKYGDVVARSSNGALRTYFASGKGGWASSVVAGSGYNAFKLLF